MSDEQPEGNATEAFLDEIQAAALASSLQDLESDAEIDGPINPLCEFRITLPPRR